MTYKNRWIGYEEGHQEERYHNHRDYPEYVWITDFFIRLDSQAFRIDYKGRGINIFWADFFHHKRWRVLRSSILDVATLLGKRIRER